MGIQLKNIGKKFNGLILFRNFDLHLDEHKISCILGPSGCGKTSLLNMIGGILTQDSGSISGMEKKGISFIFQEPRLLPWKNVRSNLEFVLSDIPVSEKENIINRNLKFVGLQNFADYYPEYLSGGMKQRVSIARAFSYPSDIILMDEPLKALDPKLKWNLMKTFKELWDKDRRTVIFVTHDVDEALVMGEEIYIFSNPPVRVKKHLTNHLPESQKKMSHMNFLETKNTILAHLD
jgi:NitT/TauT family transport system ATP-binding protein